LYRAIASAASWVVAFLKRHALWLDHGKAILTPPFPRVKPPRVCARIESKMRDSFSVFSVILVREWRQRSHLAPPISEQGIGGNSLQLSLFRSTVHVCAV